ASVRFHVGRSRQNGPDVLSTFLRGFTAARIKVCNLHGEYKRLSAHLISARFDSRTAHQSKPRSSKYGFHAEWFIYHVPTINSPHNLTARIQQRRFSISKQREYGVASAGPFHFTCESDVWAPRVFGYGQCRRRHWRIEDPISWGELSHSG